MIKIFLIAVILFILLSTTLLVYACEPCPKTLNFEETVKKANLIIIGKKIFDGPRTDRGKGWGGPDWIDVKIIRVLKGNTNQKIIRVNSWSGMCPYGIIVNKGPYVMLLEKADIYTQHNHGHQYDAVDWGCSITTYRIDNNKVNFEGQKISIEGFIKELASIKN